MSVHDHRDPGRVDELAGFEIDEDALAISCSIYCLLQLGGDSQVELPFDTDLPAPWTGICFGQSEMPIDSDCRLGDWSRQDAAQASAGMANWITSSVPRFRPLRI